MKRIGIDVGGTNTDAVLIDGDAIVASIKVPTTQDVLSGVKAALAHVSGHVGAADRPIDAVMIGTTHFTNAVVERARLERVAAIRIALPTGSSLPPMCDWPKDLYEAVDPLIFMVHGGHEYDGSPLVPMIPDEVREAAMKIRDAGITSIAISATFSPLTTECEVRAAEIVRSVIPDARITLSHTLGRIGLLERENVALLNAALQTLGRTTVQAFSDALREAGVKAPFYLTQNDGTVALADVAAANPVHSFASGPTNSMRGAAFLTGLSDAMVVDVGGTTSDVGSLSHGFPRQASTTVDIGGVRTNFRMPDVFSIGLGGGSLVVNGEHGLTVGPKSVGYRVRREALCFGGTTLTATDIAVASGKADVGEKALVSTLDKRLVDAAVKKINDMLESCVERSRISSSPVPVIAVGGGSILMPDRIGDLDVIRPENFAVANAVGAAIAQISGETDRVFSLIEGRTRESALAEAEAEAREKAIAAGALAETLEVIEREDMPLAYLPGNATRIHVKVVGEMGANHG
ncbi:MAG TPA: hydantoinase [Agrobacterium sp.]|nr:hydantoinase [Agrobacterium sp.]